MKKISCFFILVLVTGVTSIKSQDTIKGAEVKTIDVIAPGEMLVEDEPVFVTAEKNARFQGGDLNTFREWVQKN